MVTTVAEPETVGREAPSSLGVLSLAGVASIAAGAIHATAAGAHSEHRQAMWVFVALALFQIGWGVLALLRPGTRLALVGAAGNAVAFGGWLAAKTVGIGLVDGLEATEDVQLADAAAAVLAGIVVLTALVAAVGLLDRARALRPPALAGAAVLAVAVAVPAMASAADHRHVGDHHTSATSAAGNRGVVHHAPAVATHPFDPTQPIDLSGVPGVTPEEQARAENLLAISLVRLPRWSDPAVAEAAGYHSIGDAATGYNHLVNWSLLDDGHVLDPDYPESLVYRVDGAGGRTLEAAMFMLPPGTSLDDVPDIGGALTQFHVHDNLCLTDDPVAPQIRSVVPAGSDCPEGLVRVPQVPMMHVWIVPHRCGPFAALEGVGAGQIAEDQERACDHVHGSS